MGCSSSESTVQWIGGEIINGSKVLSVTEYAGTEATTIIDNVGTIKYYLCNTMDDCDHNKASTSIDDMTDFKGKSKYYTMYHGTEIFLYVPYGKAFIESHMELVDVGVMSVEQAVEMMYNESKRLYIGDEVKTINFDDIVEINVANRVFAVRKDEAIIPGLLRVKKDTGEITATEHVTIDKKSVGKTSSTKYDYYQYNGIIIQAAIGSDPSTLFTLK